MQALNMPKFHQISSGWHRRVSPAWSVFPRRSKAWCVWFSTIKKQYVGISHLEDTKTMSLVNLSIFIIIYTYIYIQFIHSFIYLFIYYLFMYVCIYLCIYVRCWLKMAGWCLVPHAREIRTNFFARERLELKRSQCRDAKDRSAGTHMEWCLDMFGYVSTLWWTNKKLWKMAIEIVDFPINSMVIFHCKLLVHQRVGQSYMDTLIL